MTPPTCPHCAWPIHGLRHVDDSGVSWHLGCAEKREKAAADAAQEVGTDGLDFWAEKE